MTAATARRSERDFAFVLNHPGGLFIGGQWMAPVGGAARMLMSPGSGERFITVAGAGAADVDLAVAAARRAFDEGPWPRLSHRERAEKLSAISREITARAEMMGGLQAAEMGALFGMAVAFVPHFAGAFDFYAAMAASFAFIEPRTPPIGGAGHLVRWP